MTERAPRRPKPPPQQPPFGVPLRSSDVLALPLLADRPPATTRQREQYERLRDELAGLDGDNTVMAGYRRLLIVLELDALLPADSDRARRQARESVALLANLRDRNSNPRAVTTRLLP